MLQSTETSFALHHRASSQGEDNPDPDSQLLGWDMCLTLPPPEGGGGASHRPTCQAEEQEDLQGPASSKNSPVLAGQVTALLPAANVTWSACCLRAHCAQLSTAIPPWRGQITQAAQEAGANTNPEEENGDLEFNNLPKVTELTSSRGGI